MCMRAHQMNVKYVSSHKTKNASKKKLHAFNIVNFKIKISCHKRSFQKKSLTKPLITDIIFHMLICQLLFSAISFLPLGICLLKLISFLIHHSCHFGVRSAATAYLHIYTI